MSYALHDAFSRSIYQKAQTAASLSEMIFFRDETNEFPAHVSIFITKIKRPFLTDDLYSKVALHLNYVPLTQNIQISQQKT